MTDERQTPSVLSTVATVVIVIAGVLVLRDIVFTDPPRAEAGSETGGEATPIIIEAEDFDAVDRDESSPEGHAILVIPAEAVAFGTGYIDIPEGIGKPGYEGRPDDWGWADYTFNVPSTGDYVLYVRAWWLDQCGNSARFRFNDDSATHTVTGSIYEEWRWDKAPRRIPLKAGENTVRFINNEDGVRLDRFILVPAGAPYRPPQFNPDE